MSCDICGHTHEAWQSHVFSRASTNIQQPASTNAPIAASTNTMNRRKRWRERHPDAYRAYQREYMRRRRAAARS